jgi:hypothetical protein
MYLHFDNIRFYTKFQHILSNPINNYLLYPL